MGDRVRAIADTHALIWWLNGDAHLSNAARKLIAAPSNEVLISAATAWELSIKNKSGKLQVQPLLDRFAELINEQGFEVLPITVDHAVRAGALPVHHADPFDRMLVAQAQAEHLAIISADKAFDHYGVRRIW
jgi:PIN domain nuclease of toxin-antitoxin system